MKQLVIYVHGKGGTAQEYEHYKNLFKNSDVIGFDYKSNTPWDAMKEFSQYFDSVREGYSSIILIANSIGAYFSRLSLMDKKIDKMLLISPVVDMERLIKDMMNWAKITEKELQERKIIPTNFGEDLSWEYYCFAKEHKINCKIETHILYGENDNLTSYQTISKFATKNNATLSVMKNGEHWFHTQEQMQFLDNWIKNIMKF